MGRITRNCRKCRRQAEHVYYKFKIPRSDDDAGWQDLQNKVRLDNRQTRNRVLAQLRRERERLERMLAQASESRQDRRRVLSFKLKSINAQMEQWSLW